LSGAVTHFEIYAEEPETLADLFRKLFGWRLERPIAGARSWVHYIHVASLDDAVDEAERLGAAVLRPKTAVPRAAWYAVLADPEGNIFAMYQSDPAAFPKPEPE
jgi:uncharacterized protein